MHCPPLTTRLAAMLSRIGGLALLAALAAQAHGAPVVGPTSRLYLASISDRSLFVLQGADVVARTQTYCNHCEVPIAVAGDVRTASSNGGFGGLYGTDLSKTGTTYASTVPNGSNLRFSDGATDGHHNFAIGRDVSDPRGPTTIFSFDRDWSGQSTLFNLNSTTRAIGITYDPSNNSFWLLGQVFDDVGGVHDVLQDYSMQGALLSEFSTLENGRSLAMDYADGTLWAVRGNAGYFDQYDKSGALLQTVSYDPILGFQGGNIGAEFDLGATSTVPEPAGLVWLGLGLLGMLTARRKGRGQAGPAQSGGVSGGGSGGATGSAGQPSSSASRVTTQPASAALKPDSAVCRPASVRRSTSAWSTPWSWCTAWLCSTSICAMSSHNS